MNRKSIAECLVDTGIKYHLLKAEEREQELERMSDIGDDPMAVALPEAIQNYADQEMALFAEWLLKNKYRPFEGVWLPNADVRKYQTETYTTQQLITKYKEENP